MWSRALSSTSCVLGSRRSLSSLAETTAEQVRGWHRLCRGGVGARIKVCPKQTVDSFLPNGWMIDEQRVRIMISEKGLLGHAI
ncbi:hypothetical protein [Prauserella flavalba]|uniref:Uncharacterized protein n=1 Tax=Prauserella flavalba TaxID=1477506 RepID=A0A318LTV0_9PSEU|nr:hypothetical protein [Prauserella flavalba]PXY37251.1 hypothetical protein BA062_07120 [Prauserella flavalba]